MKFAIIGFVFFMLSCTDQNVDLIIYNTKVYDLDSTKVIANSVVIKNRKIVKVGYNLEQQYSTDNKIDAKGNLLLPGFNDAHAHMIGAGLTMQKVDLSTSKTKQATLDKIRNAVKSTPEGKWITGRGWNHELWEDKSWPTAKELDEITTKHPIYLRRVDGHSGWTNSLAMNIAGITDATQDPQGGEIKRDKNGVANGIFVDAAETLIQSVIPEETMESLKLAALQAQEHALSQGVTSITTIGNHRYFEVYRSLLNEDKLKMRINFVPDYSDSLPEFKIEMPEVLNVQHVKVYMDGSLGSRSAWLTHPYDDEKSTSGLPQQSDEQLINKLKKIKSYNLEPMIHAIGDKGNEHLLKIYNEYIEENKIVKSRFRVEHAQILNKNCYELFEKAGIIASMQPKHCISDMLWVENRLGKERSKHAYPWKTILNRNIHLAFGTDWPIEPLNPFYGVYGAVTRQFMEDTELNKGWIPEQKISVNESIKAYTSGSAYAEYMEDEKGKIKEGYFADFILVDKDIFDINPMEIKNVTVLKTFVGGAQVN